MILQSKCCHSTGEGGRTARDDGDSQGALSSLGDESRGPLPEEGHSERSLLAGPDWVSSGRKGPLCARDIMVPDGFQ